MKVRTLKELYELLFYFIKDKEYITSLCANIYSLWYLNVISGTEFDIIYEHFKSQKYLHPEFMVPERNWSGEKYWWTKKEDYNPINRKAFILKIISKL